MFDKKWNIIIIVLVILLIIVYFCSKSEGFATNDEAIANVASIYNKDNMTVTNMTATNLVQGKALYVSGTDKGTTHFPYLGDGKGDNYIRGTTHVENGDLNVTKNLNVTGAITSPTINTINARIATLEAINIKNRIEILEKNVFIEDANRMEQLKPSQYWAKGKGTYKEFKGGGFAGSGLSYLEDLSGWSLLTTIVQYGDGSGGPIKQFLYTDRAVLFRNSKEGDTWGLWWFLRDVPYGG